MNRHTHACRWPVRTTRLVVVAAAVFGFTPAGSAHDLKASVTFTVSEVRVVAGYDDDTPADGAKVTVTDARGQQIAAGELDDAGSWTTPLPPPGKYQLVVSDAGHRDRVEFTVDGPAAAVTGERWRLDKTFGLAVGLGVLLGGTLLYVVFRRKAPTA